MPDPTPRMAQLRAMLADDPHDAFLLYGLAMEHAGQGDDAEAARVLREIIAREPYVPAYLQAGQALLRLGDDAEAAAVLRAGVAEAERQGNAHAAGEMAGFLASIE